MNTTQETASPHWAINLIGKPWLPEWNCWELVRGVYVSKLGVELPSFPKVDLGNAEGFGKAIHAGTLSPDWVECDRPGEFAVVAMSRKNIFHHVGLWTEVDGGRVVHVQEGTCTVADSLSYLQKVGWQRIGFFKWRTL